MVTVHMIGSAHIDPVWLWRWPAGVIEALSTCRTAADILEKEPEACFTRSDQWIYEQIESLDPELFGRIAALVRAGRWAAVGGWYVQPDCNLPLAESFHRHMDYGKAYFASRFGVDVTVGYNVDSFGHHAMLPSLLSEHGFTSYVMMRPGPHEKELPASLFRWQSPDEREVVTWRIVDSYNCEDPARLEAHILSAVKAAHPDVPHVMCFFGVGDHGGGPSRRLLEWIRAHRDSVSGARLVLSHPGRFFDAVLPLRERLPVVQDELQHHAIGCYSVVRDIKTGVRSAEHALLRAETCLRMHPSLAPDGVRTMLEGAWKEVLFNQFHDILAGSSIPEAYRDAADQLGLARAAAESLTHATLFRSVVALPPDRCQRIVLSNLSSSAFDGPIAYEPWTAWKPFAGRLEDSSGAEIPFQVLQQPAIVGPKRMLLWLDSLGAGGTRILRLRPEHPPREIATDLEAAENRIAAQAWRVRAGRKGGPRLVVIDRMVGGRPVPLLSGGLRAVVLHDASDTWSHGISSFEGPPAGMFRLERSVIEETGPLRATLRADASLGRSSLVVRVRLYAGAPYLDVELELSWFEQAKLAKLVFPLAERFAARRDGIPGGSIERRQDGREYPLVDWTVAPPGLAIAAPDCFALDGRDGELRFTLVRSPVYAWHDPTKLCESGRYRHTDQGEHSFRFRIRAGGSPQTAAADAAALHDPPLCLDWTRGMGEEFWRSDACLCRRGPE